MRYNICYSASVVVGLLGLATSGCNGAKETQKPVEEITVRFTDKNGKWHDASAGTVAEAWRLAWRQVFVRVNDSVAVDPENSLMGVHEGTYKFVIRQGGHEHTYKLLDPIMERESVDSTDWSPSLANIPKHMREAFAGD